MTSCYAQCPSSCQISSHSAERCTRKALQFSKPLSIFVPQGHPWAKVHQSWPWYTARPPLSTCQISSHSENLCTRYLLPNLVNFVDGVAYKTSKRYISAYHPATKILLKYYKENWNHFLLVVLATALKQQISKILSAILTHRRYPSYLWQSAVCRKCKS